MRERAPRDRGRAPVGQDDGCPATARTSACY